MAANQTQDSPLRVLVVDDNTDAAVSTVALVQLLGCIAEACFDGHSALDLAARSRPDVAFIDWDMPGLDGLAVAAHLRRTRETSGCPFLVCLTAHCTAEAKALALQAGFDLFVSKPMKLAVLHDALRSGDRRRGQLGP